MSDSAARGRGPESRRLILAGIVIVAILTVGYIGLVFLGSQVDTALRGTIEFGTGGSGCTVEGRASTFPANASVYEVAHLTREVVAGETVTFRVSRDGTELASVPRAFDVTGDCLGGTLPGALLTPGHYRVEYHAGSEPLASGEFDVAP
jgi:hypothetical protein